MVAVLSIGWTEKSNVTKSVFDAVVAVSVGKE